MDDYHLPSRFRMAKLASYHSSHYKPMGAVIIRGGSVLGFGCNIFKTHPIFSENRQWYSIHAEMNAILHSPYNLNGSTIFVYRERCDGTLGMAKPCTNCMKILIEKGIRRVYYTISEAPYFQIMEV